MARAKQHRARQQRTPPRLRIIGGDWRGRRLSVPAGSDVRPTPDRVRETLFNWLQAGLPGARCLDLFAGSGALGLEALSRGAEHVVFVEREERLREVLRENIGALPGAEQRSTLVADDALGYLARAGPSFDLVFVDPPYQSRLVPRVLRALAEGRLAPGGRGYVETPAEPEPEPLPEGWTELRSGRAGAVAYRLVARAQD